MRPAPVEGTGETREVLSTFFCSSVVKLNFFLTTGYFSRDHTNVFLQFFF